MALGLRRGRGTRRGGRGRGGARAGLEGVRCQLVPAARRLGCDGASAGPGAQGLLPAPLPGRRVLAPQERAARAPGRLPALPAHVPRPAFGFRASLRAPPGALEVRTREAMSHARDGPLLDVQAPQWPAAGVLFGVEPCLETLVSEFPPVGALHGGEKAEKLEWVGVDVAQGHWVTVSGTAARSPGRTASPGVPAGSKRTIPALRPTGGPAQPVSACWGQTPGLLRRLGYRVGGGQQQESLVVK